MIKNATINQELINKLSNIVRAYDPYTAYIDDYKQYSNAVAINCEMDQRFIRTCNKYGYDVKVSYCYSLAESLASGKFDSAEDVVIDYIDSLNKEETTMINNTNNSETSNSTTTKKEVITMTNEMIKKLDTLNRTMQLVQVLEWCDNIKNVHDVCYVKKDVIAQFLFDKGLIGHQLSKRELKRITRDELIVNLREAVDNLTNAGIITPATPVAEVVSVGDFCNDKVPEFIDESPATVVFDDGLALKILERVIHQADTNNVHNFISDWMLTSIISELVLGHPLKDKEHEYYKSFTAEQKKILVDIRKAFIKTAKLVAKYNNSKISGYYIPAKVLVWGRHVYLNKACVYKFIDKDGRPLAEYMVSINGIKDTATGKVVPLSDDKYDTLDTKCVFIR